MPYNLYRAIFIANCNIIYKNSIFDSICKLDVAEQPCATSNLVNCMWPASLTNLRHCNNIAYISHSALSS